MKPKPVPAGYLMIGKDGLANRINRLPIWARRYIHDLETRADPSGDIPELADLRDQRDGLVKMVEQLKKENRRLRQEWMSGSPIECKPVRSKYTSAMPGHRTATILIRVQNNNWPRLLAFGRP